MTYRCRETQEEVWCVWKVRTMRALELSAGEWRVARWSQSLSIKKTLTKTIQWPMMKTRQEHHQWRKEWPQVYPGSLRTCKLKDPHSALGRLNLHHIVLQLQVFALWQNMGTKPLFFFQNLRCSGRSILHISINSGWSQHYQLHQDWWGRGSNFKCMQFWFWFQKPWCSTKVDSSGVQEVGHWGYCPFTGC